MPPTHPPGTRINILIFTCRTFKIHCHQSFTIQTRNFESDSHYSIQYKHNVQLQKVSSKITSHAFQPHPLLILCAVSYDQFEIGADWLDTNGQFIQGHGGHVSYLDGVDCFNNGSTGCWIWYGEDKWNVFGIHCYISSDLYNWVDKGRVLQVHNVVPEKLNDDKSGIVPDDANLAELKRRANLDAPEQGVTQEDIDIAHDFLAPYATEKDAQGKYTKFDEASLAFGFRYLFKTYSIVERPKMLRNTKFNNYVLLFHCDGPSDDSIRDWLKASGGGFSGGTYVRAMIGFAVSDSPFGPFKLVNALGARVL